MPTLLVTMTLCAYFYLVLTNTLNTWLYWQRIEVNFSNVLQKQHHFGMIAPQSLPGETYAKVSRGWGLVKMVASPPSPITVSHHRKKTNAISRGALVSGYLKGNESADDYIHNVMTQSHVYDEFNLLVGDKQSLLFFCSVEDDYQTLKSGLYGISNGKLDSPWPKVVKGKTALEKITQTSIKPEPEKLFDLLADKTIAADSELPSTGVSLEWERSLSPLFVQFEGYGTRSSTILLIDKQGEVFFSERSFDKEGQVIDTRSYQFLNK